jgi:hypothetical protein
MDSDRVRSHQDLRVWKLARSMAVDVYRYTAALPAEERFGLQAQMRRAAVSGSLAELETQSLLCEDLGLLTRNDELHRQIRGIRLMLNSLQKALRARRSPVSPMSPMSPMSLVSFLR